MTPIIEKLQKLIAHEQSARKIGNQAEAEAFAGRIQELLTKHKLSMGDLEFDQQEAAEPIKREHVKMSDVGLKNDHKRVQWTEYLASGIAEVNCCRALVFPGWNGITIVGRESDRQAVIWLFGFLARTAQDLATKEAKTYRDTPDFTLDSLVAVVKRGIETKSAEARAVKRFKSSFLLGFAVAVVRRLEEQKKATAGAAEMQAAVNAAGGRSTALARIDRADKAVKDFVESEVKGTARERKVDVEGHGFSRGFDAGQKANITGKVLGEGKATSAITS